MKRAKIRQSFLEGSHTVLVCKTAFLSHLCITVQSLCEVTMIVGSRGFRNGPSSDVGNVCGDEVLDAARPSDKHFR